MIISPLHEKLSDLSRINWQLLERVRELESELAEQVHLTRIREIELEHWKRRALRMEMGI
jgi:hypothetical protein|tara:strand:+ start:103 stop:282 length:180 start_codon:yes stop_codon:yes gene_type:complete